MNYRSSFINEVASLKCPLSRNEHQSSQSYFISDPFMSMTVFQQYKDHYSKNTLINNDDEWVKLDMFTHPGFI